MMERKSYISYIRQDKCCETCAHLTEEGCYGDNEAQDELDEVTGKYGVNCADWEHWPLNEDEEEIVRLEAENARLRKVVEAARKTLPIHQFTSNYLEVRAFIEALRGLDEEAKGE